MASLLQKSVTGVIILIVYIVVGVIVMVKTSYIWFENRSHIKNLQDLPHSKNLLTLFTTALDKPWKRTIHNNTFRNWALLQPDVTPLLYYSRGDTLRQMALRNGWRVLKVPKTNSKGTPVLKTMFTETEKQFSSHFYAYANADILFDEGLIKTLKLLIRLLNSTRQVMITGRRVNVPVNMSVTSLRDVSMLRRNHKLFGDNAQDFFISFRNGYDWSSIPDFVVGRVGYDNWLVVHAIVKRMVVIDVTETVIAIHQSGMGGNFEGWAVSKDEKFHNYAQAGKSFDYSLGRTTCSEYKTKFNEDKYIIVQHRNASQTPCKNILQKAKVIYNDMKLLELQLQLKKTRNAQ